MCLKEENKMNKKYAVLVVDMLNDFVTGAIGCDRARDIIKPTQELLEIKPVQLGWFFYYLESCY